MKTEKTGRTKPRQQAAASGKASSASRKKKKKKKGRRWTAVLKYLSLGAAVLGLLAFGFIFSVHAGLWGALPTYGELKGIRNDEASVLYSEDGRMLGKYFTENRTNINFKNIPRHAVDALIATEDVRFYQHEGVDRVSMLRVFFKTFLLGNRQAGGGSTISQQLAKNLFPRSSQPYRSIVIIKLKEMFTARRLENLYSKEEILTLYLNTVPFGEDCYGLESASQKYFGMPASRLDLPRAATLVGMLKAPSSYNPRLHPEKARQRRNTVIARMVRYGYLTAEEGERYSRRPLGTDYRSSSHFAGPAPYLRERIRRQALQILETYNNVHGTSYNLYRDGLVLTTTLDSRLQAHAEKAVALHMKSLQETFYRHWGEKEPWHPSIFQDAVRNSPVYRQLKAKGKTEGEIRETMGKKRPMLVYDPEGGEKEVLFSSLDSIGHYLKILHPAMLAVDPRNGKIKVWVGGRDYKYFQYDQIEAPRQCGSVFKPVIYSAAVAAGARTDAWYADERKSYAAYDGWSPRNAGNSYGGYYTMKGALCRSINTIAVEVLMQTGLDRVREYAGQLGISASLPPYPSLALGTAEIPLLQMVCPYMCFAAGGILHHPYCLLEIRDREGKVLYRAPEDKGRRVMTTGNADLMNDMLTAVVREGTGQRLDTRYGVADGIAGKTGTTQNQADGWFIGYNPRLVAGIRVGADNAGIHFNSTSLGQGANTALPIFGIFMQECLEDKHFSDWRGLSFPPVSPRIAGKDQPLYKERLDLGEKLSNRKMDRVRKDGEKRREGFFRRLFGRKRHRD